MKKLRGGNWGLIGTGAFLGLMILIFSMGEGFVPNIRNLGWGLDRPNPYQPPTAEHRYPPYYDLFFPRRTCYADRPGGSQIMAGVNPQSSREELTQLSTYVVPTQTQMSGFVEKGEVNLHKCLDEVNRRASEIGCTDFECSLERFKALATEDGTLTNTTAREAITILQGEMYGYYRNARREDYGLDIKGPDFIVEGLRKFQNITHVEIKNPVGSAILQSLQTLKPVLDYFDDIYFRSSVIFPYLKIQKRGQVFIATVAIAEQLYFYRYPFQFNNYFKTSKNKYQLLVKIQIIQV